MHCPAGRITASRIAVFVFIALTSFGFAQDPKADARRNARRTPVVYVVEKIAPSVVSINAEIPTRGRYSPWDSLFGNGDGVPQALGKSEGSGVLIHPAGYIVTNDHVVARARSIEVALSDERKFKATVVGTDPSNDIAILKLDSDGPFTAAPLGRSDDLMLGEPAIALGNPFGLHGSVTEGIISAINRPIQFNGKDVFTDFMQTSAVINPGNSGGPLVNINGEVIGINVAIHSRGPGIGFAIPINRVREVVHKVLDPRMTKRAHLGLDVDYMQEQPGVRVTNVDAEGPAKLAGLVVGDVIQSLNGRPVQNWIDFQARISQMRAGDKVDLAVRRGDKSQQLVVDFKELVSASERALFDYMGFSCEDLGEGQNTIGGVRVTKVDESSSAWSIGIRQGDILIAVGGYRVGNLSQFFRAAQTIQGQEAARLDIIRDNVKMSGTIVWK